jgi:hypothetical protein
MRVTASSRKVMGLAICAAVVMGCAGAGRSKESGAKAGSLAIREDVGERLRKFSPTPITCDLSQLSASERAVLDRLIRASRLMDEIYLRQVSARNPEIREALEESKDRLAKEALHYFTIAFGPWDPLAEDEPFVGRFARPPGASFYPEDLSKEELKGWLAKHPEDEKAFKRPTTVIRRQGDRLVAVPYSKEYREWLEPAAKLLREAAAITEDPSLARFLRLRADAFLSDDYFESDLAWMDLASRIEVTVGPYETYTDKLFGYKAAFESFVTVQDPQESARLAAYASRLPEMEANLPIPDELKNLNRGTESPIRVAYEVFTAGDTKAGVQTIAFNLPNDERVRERKGSKKVLLKNVMEAKFDRVLVPIADRVVVAEQRPDVTFEAFFTETLLHELSHGLGPGLVALPSGEKVDVKQALEELGAALEEAKADVMGVYNAEFLMERGIVPRELERALFPTYLAGMFRSARFGVEEAHGQATVVQFNWLLEAGGFVFEPDTGRLRVHPAKAKGAVRSLLERILTIQARGDYAGAKALFAQYGRPTPEMRRILDGFGDIPVDIEPIYTAVASRRP